MSQNTVACENNKIKTNISTKCERSYYTYQTNATLGDDIRYRVSQLNTDDGIGTGDSHHREDINDRVPVVYK